MTAHAQAFDQRVAADTLDGIFTGGIDIGDDHRVGIVEAGTEILEQVAQAGVAMRLHHGDDAGVLAARQGEPGGTERKRVGEGKSGIGTVGSGGVRSYKKTTIKSRDSSRNTNE